MTREPLAVGLLRKPASLNKTEGRYFEQLLVERSEGKLVAFEAHALTLLLGPDCRYTPDFLVLRPQLGLPSAAFVELELHEVKGPYIRTGDDGLVKLRTAAAKFPWFHFVLAQEQARGQFERRWIQP